MSKEGGCGRIVVTLQLKPLHICSCPPHLQQTLLLAQVFVHFSEQVVQALLHLLARILLDNFTQFLFVKGQLVAHLLLTHTLCHTSFHTFKEVL